MYVCTYDFLSFLPSFPPSPVPRSSHPLHHLFAHPRESALPSLAEPCGWGSGNRVGSHLEHWKCVADRVNTKNNICGGVLDLPGGEKLDNLY